jgi:hypothetical protein
MPNSCQLIVTPSSFQIHRHLHKTLSIGRRNPPTTKSMVVSDILSYSDTPNNPADFFQGISPHQEVSIQLQPRSE